MKDKEKQIEEMKNNARIYIGAVVEKLRMDGCELYEIDGIVENILNYIALPEDSVVLSREEFEKLKNESIDKLFADDTFFKEEFKANEECLRKRANRDYIKLVKKQARKETAERDFNNIIKALEIKKASIITHYGVKESVGADVAIRTVKELAKQLSVEIKEN